MECENQLDTWCSAITDETIGFGEAGVPDTRGFRVAGWEADLRAEPAASSAERSLRVGER